MRALLSLVSLVLVCLALPIPALAQATDPNAVFPAYLAAINAGDLDRAVDYFTDDAVFRTPQGDQFVGRAQIRPRLQALISAHNRFEIVSGPRTEGDRLIYNRRAASDNFRRLGIDWVEETTEIVVRNGKIAAHLNSQSPETLARIRAAQAQAAGAPAQLPRTGDPFGPGAAVLGAALVLGGWRLRRGV